MHKIMKSILPDEESENSFQRLCNLQINELRAHDKHMTMVKKDPERYHPYPPPSAHPDIMAAIVKEDGDYNISYEIIDDTSADLAPSEPTLEEKKSALVEKLHSAAAELQQPLLPPPLKQRLLHIELMKIPQDPAERTPEQQAQLDAQLVLSQKLGKLNEAVAIAESAIDDLTEDNVDQWTMPDLSESLQ